MRRLASVATLSRVYDLVIVGAGPAGMAAALEASRAGISILLLDENHGLGGQAYRALETSPLAHHPLLFPPAGRTLAAALATADIEFLPGATVWHLDAALNLGLSAAGRARTIRAKRVILATGALERPMPIAGWTLPGVMTVGAAQTVLKAQGLVPAGRVVIAGCGPLVWLYAAQLIAFGCPPAAVLETTPRTNWRAALRHLPAFLRSPYFRKGLTLLATVRRAVRVVSGVSDLAITPANAALQVRWPGGQMVADLVLLHQGIVPHLNLAQAAGCAVAWNAAQACYVPLTDAWGQSSLPGIAIAGDAAGISGAESAEISGRLAALDALCHLGVLNRKQRDTAALAYRDAAARWRRGRAFLDVMYRPALAFRVSKPEAIACRCEEVTGAALREAVRYGVSGPNQAKAFLRCGMGPCQGRLCLLTVVETIAAERGLDPAAILPLRSRPPVKPLTLAELATLESTPEELAAVEAPLLPVAREAEDEDNSRRPPP